MLWDILLHVTQSLPGPRLNTLKRVRMVLQHRMCYTLLGILIAASFQIHTSPLYLSSPIEVLTGAEAFVSIEIPRVLVLKFLSSN